MLELMQKIALGHAGSPATKSLPAPLASWMVWAATRKDRERKTACLTAGRVQHTPNKQAGAAAVATSSTTAPSTRRPAHALADSQYYAQTPRHRSG